MEDKLSIKDNIENVVEAGINAIPVVGGALSTLYFGRKQEKRFKRIEKFYEILQSDFEAVREKVANLEEVNKDALTGIIESINENVEKDYLEEKLIYFKNCFYNSLIEQNAETYGKRQYFIDTLGKVTEMDISIIKYLYDNVGRQVKGINTPNQSKMPELWGALEKLKSYGFVFVHIGGMLESGINWNEVNSYSISDFGKEFVEYCLQLNRIEILPNLDE